jgi:hypothetical protein
MTEYAAKSYGRNKEVAAIFRHFDAKRDVSMAGPRRLGKTFVLDRLVETAGGLGWTALKVEVGGCTDSRAFFRSLCKGIGSIRSGAKTAIAWIQQRFGQIVDPRSDNPGEWYQPLLSLDHESYFERLVKALNEDRQRRWALLIDELPIFLKALHDQGPKGVEAARNFMNLTSRLRADHPRVRWMITGSIGLEPLARAGNYMGVLAKFETFDLQPLNEAQAKDFVKDIAQEGRLHYRQAITDPEAEALVAAVGWRSAYYLEALAKKLTGEPCDNTMGAKALVEDAVQRLLAPGEAATFGVWEEHVRKHYRDAERRIAFATLAAIAQKADGLRVDALLAAVGNVEVTKRELRAVLTRLHVEGFLTVSDWEGDDPTAAFLNPLLRRWWNRFPPQATS